MRFTVCDKKNIKNSGIIIKMKNSQLSSFLYCLIIYLVLINSSSSFASNEAKWIIDSIQVENGLPDSTVFSIQQDQHGFMWFGTTNGIARYDGQNFLTFRHDDADVNSISSNNSGNLFIDSKNNLWIGTFGGGLNVLKIDEGEIHRFPYSSHDFTSMISENVQTFIEDSHGKLWIGTGTGLYQLADNGLKFFPQDEAHANDLSHIRIWDLLQTEDEYIWISTSAGLSKFDPTTGTYEYFKLPDELLLKGHSDQFRTLFSNNNNFIWIGSSTGLVSFNQRTRQFTAYDDADQPAKINDIELTKEGNLIIASITGIYQFDIEKQHYKRNQEGTLWQMFSELDVRDIFYDSSEIIWLATRDGGIVTIDTNESIFQQHTDYIKDQADWSNNKNVWVMEKGLPGEIYFGTSETVYRKTNNEYQKITIDNQKAIPGRIRSLHHSTSGGMWIGSTSGLYYLNDHENVAQAITTPFDLTGIKPTNIFSIEEANNGILWFSLFNEGLLNWDPKTNHAVLIKNLPSVKVIDINILDLLQDSQQNLWVASSLGGLIYLNPVTNQVDTFMHDPNNPKSIATNRIRSVFEDSNNRLWVATFEGLDEFDRTSKSFIHHTQQEELLNGSIQTITEDENNMLWLSGKFGVTKYDPVSKKFTHYPFNSQIQIDGLDSNSSVIQDNQLYIAGVEGFYSLDTNGVFIDNKVHSKLIFTKIEVDNKSIPFNQLISNHQKIDLNHQDQRLAIEFASLGNKSTDQTRFAYRVKGLYEDWIDASRAQKFMLNNLNPGDYMIEIKGSNSFGNWGIQGLAIDLTVHPAWWNKPITKFLIAIASLFLIYILHSYRTFSIKRRNFELEREVENRTAELKQLNNQLFHAANTDFLTGIPNRMAYIKSFEEKIEYLDVSTKSAYIIMADIDHFKKVNDQFGHAFGDEVLKQVCQIFASMIRDNDILARWGGEEFIFYMEGSSEHEVLSIIEKIRQVVQETVISFKDQSIRITVTFGICKHHVADSLDQSIGHADQTMYQGKSKGRNNINVFESCN